MVSRIGFTVFLCSCTAGQSSQPVTVDMIVTYFSSHRRLELKSDPRENNSHPCAPRTLPFFCVVSTPLHGSGAGIPEIGILIYSWCCGIGISSGDGICCARSSWAARSSRAASKYPMSHRRNYGWQRWYTGWAEADEEQKASYS